jgi:AbrB family looped-hinge helix DNA binding protein
MKAKVAERGQVTIPKALRDRLGIRSGTILEFAEKNGQLVIVKANQKDAIDQVYGSLGLGRKTDQLIDDLRGGP